MKKYLVFLLLFIAAKSFAQDSAFTYSKIINCDSLEIGKIYDKAMVWCSKNFNESKSAINMHERESGTIAGKAFYYSAYKIAGKKDSMAATGFSNYYFDWLIEIKTGKLRFSVSNIQVEALEKKYAVTTSDVAPMKIAFAKTERVDREWRGSKDYFIQNLNGLMANLEMEINNKDDF